MKRGFQVLLHGPRGKTERSVSGIEIKSLAQWDLHQISINYASSGLHQTFQEAREGDALSGCVLANNNEDCSEAKKNRNAALRFQL